MSLACHIIKALAEIHEVGVVLSNLSVEHIVVNETQCNEENRDEDSCITVHIISLGPASIIPGKMPQKNEMGTNSFTVDEENGKNPVQNDLRSLGD
eukprot:12228699-Ditylum_brightwellii.AAC.1